MLTSKNLKSLAILLSLVMLVGLVAGCAAPPPAAAPAAEVAAPTEAAPAEAAPTEAAACRSRQRRR